MALPTHDSGGGPAALPQLLDTLGSLLETDAPASPREDCESPPPSPRLRPRAVERVRQPAVRASIDVLIEARLRAAGAPSAAPARVASHEGVSVSDVLALPEADWHTLPRTAPHTAPPVTPERALRALEALGGGGGADDWSSSDSDWSSDSDAAPPLRVPEPDGRRAALSGDEDELRPVPGRSPRKVQSAAALRAPRGGAAMSAAVSSLTLAGVHVGDGTRPSKWNRAARRAVHIDQYGFAVERSAAAEGGVDGDDTHDSEGRLRALFSPRRAASWPAYVASLHGEWDNVRATHALRALIREHGIPPRLREPIWLRVTGAWRSYCSHMNAYANILQLRGALPNLSTAQIEKDIDRTFPNNVYFSTQEGKTALFQVLHAFSWVQPDIGYCQSMNFLTALLLLFCSEENAFWLLCAIVGELLPPCYYTKDMSGIRIDTLAFDLLVEEKLGKVWRHLAAHDVPLSMFTTQWFLCLFINYLNTEPVLWVVDCFLAEGSKMLFRVALALLTAYKADVLAAGDAIQLMNTLKALPRRADVRVLQEHCFATGAVSAARVAALRERAAARAATEVAPHADVQWDVAPLVTLLPAWARRQVLADYRPLDDYRRLPAAAPRRGLAFGALHQ